MAHSYRLPVGHCNNRSNKSRKHEERIDPRLHIFKINNAAFTLYLLLDLYDKLFPPVDNILLLYSSAGDLSYSFLKQNETSNGTMKTFVRVMLATSLPHNSMSTMAPSHTDCYVPKHYAFLALFIGLGIYMCI
jgi:hypothetical protein